MEFSPRLTRANKKLNALLKVLTGDSADPAVIEQIDPFLDRHAQPYEQRTPGFPQYVSLDIGSRPPSADASCNEGGSQISAPNTLRLSAMNLDLGHQEEFCGAGEMCTSDVTLPFRSSSDNNISPRRHSNVSFHEGAYDGPHAWEVTLLPDQDMPSLQRSSSDSIVSSRGAKKRPQEESSNKPNAMEVTLRPGQHRVPAGSCHADWQHRRQLSRNRNSSCLRQAGSNIIMGPPLNPDPLPDCAPDLWRQDWSIDRDAPTTPSSSDSEERSRSPPPSSSGIQSPSLVSAGSAHSFQAPTTKKAELLRTWSKLDAGDTQMVTVEELLGQAGLLEVECPELIDHFEEVVDNGKVTQQAFLDLYLGRHSAATGSSVQANVDIVQLRNMFNTVAETGMEIRIADIIKHKDLVKSVCPALMERFSEIHLDSSATISWEELQIFMAGTESWLEYQFRHIIGLDWLKQQIRQFHRSIVLDQRRRNAGHDVKIAGNYHMIFQGNPGTGKTSMARIIAQLLHRIGVTQTDLLVEVQRDKLVSEYVGQTGPKTQKVIDEAKSGVLFIDEAYRLSQVSGKNDFGREAIEQLMAVMNDPPGKAPVMVFAGYPDDMDVFMNANSGLYRRVAYTFDFCDYSPQELARMLGGISEAAGFRLHPQLTANDFCRLAQLIEIHTQPQARELMNGGICERIFAFAKQHLDGREVLGQYGALPSMELLEADIVEACARIPLPPSRSEASDRAQLARLESRASTAEVEAVRLQRELTALKSWEIEDFSDSRSFLPSEKYEVRLCCMYACGCLRFSACKFWHNALLQIQKFLMFITYLLSRLSSLFPMQEPSTPVLPKSPISSKATAMGIFRSLED